MGHTWTPTDSKALWYIQSISLIISAYFDIASLEMKIFNKIFHLQLKYFEVSPNILGHFSHLCLSSACDREGEERSHLYVREVPWPSDILGQSLTHYWCLHNSSVWGLCFICDNEISAFEPLSTSHRTS